MKFQAHIPTPAKRLKGNGLLFAIILSALMALVLAMAFQPIRVVAQRQKETELIYRGEHLANGIRGFYFRFGRFPIYLEELIEVEPRLVRKVYTDPMSETGEWELVYLGQEHRSSIDRLRNQLLNGPDDAGRQPSALITSNSGKQIVGIKSTSRETGYREYQDSRIYNDWFFSALKGLTKSPLDRLRDLGGE